MIETTDIILYMFIYGAIFFVTGYLKDRLKFIPKWMSSTIRFVSGLCLGIWTIRLISEIVNNSL